MLFDSSNVPEMNTFQNYQLKHTEDTFTLNSKIWVKVQLWAK